MILQPINSLPTATAATSSDVLPLVVSGLYKKVTVENLAKGIPVATTSVKGLMSDADKTNLESVIVQVSNLVAPVSTPIASASTITIPSGRYVITLSGTTTVNTLVGIVPRIKYVFYYPTGTGLTFLGEPMKAGDVVEIIDV
jgi:hypothetical protein